MKYSKVFLLVISCFVLSCTSNSIYEKPEDLIPQDSMALVLKDLYLAAAAKNVTNKQLQRRFSYVPLVYQKYGIDSARFQKSNLYYTSKIDVYEPLFTKVLNSLEEDRTIFARQKKLRDSIRQDSIRKARILERKERKKRREEKKAFNVVQKDK